jgi:hypothetical protein
LIADVMSDVEAALLVLPKKASWSSRLADGKSDSCTLNTVLKLRLLLLLPLPLLLLTLLTPLLLRRNRLWLKLLAGPSAVRPSAAIHKSRFIVTVFCCALFCCSGHWAAPCSAFISASPASSARKIFAGLQIYTPPFDHRYLLTYTSV